MTTGRGFQTKANHNHKLRDVVMLDFSPNRGKKPPDTHPGVVMSELAFNHLGLCLVVPITHSLLGNKLAVEVPRPVTLASRGSSTQIESAPLIMQNGLSGRNWEFYPTISLTKC